MFCIVITSLGSNPRKLEHEQARHIHMKGVCNPNQVPQFLRAPQLLDNNQNNANKENSKDTEIWASPS